MNKPVDIVVTTCQKNAKRSDLFKKSLSSLKTNTNKDLYNLTIVVDGECFGWYDFNDALEYGEDHLLISKENVGLGPSLNNSLSYIYKLREYDQVDLNSHLICYCQDDIEYSPGWLEKLVKVWRLFHARHNVGFVTGHNAPEHKEVHKELRFGKDTILFKPWIRATQMLASANFWNSMLPIPKIDPETGRERGKPNDGLGSGVDWHFIRVHENSVCKRGMTNIVYPGLIKHIGYKNSTWLDRELPENE